MLGCWGCIGLKVELKWISAGISWCSAVSFWTKLHFMAAYTALSSFFPICVVFVCSNAFPLLGGLGWQLSPFDLSALLPPTPTPEPPLPAPFLPIDCAPLLDFAFPLPPR